MFGDHVASYTLAHALKKRLMELLIESPMIVSSPIPKPLPTTHSLVLLSFNENEKSSSYFKVFDNYCHQRFYQIITGLQDHNQPLTPRAIFDHYVDLAERFNPQLFRHLGNLRNL